MFRRRVKLPPDLYRRARAKAAALGFASVEEFVVRAVEKELERLGRDDDDDETRRQLEGLGYIS